MDSEYYTDCTEVLSTAVLSGLEQRMARQDRKYTRTTPGKHTRSAEIRAIIAYRTENTQN